MDAVDTGDEAWAAGDRTTARAAWDRAARSAHPATAAMGEARLLQVSGNVGLAVHGPRLDSALARCPPAAPWCTLAHYDARFYTHRLGLGPAPPPLPTATPADPAWTAAVERRRAWATQPPPQVPTWTLGLSPFGASGYGFGAAIVLRHPDLGLRGGRLVASAGATLSDDHQLLFAFDSPGGVWLHADAQSRRTTLAGAAGTSSPAQWRSHDVGLGPGLRASHLEGWVAARLWSDTAGTAGQSLGADVHLSWSRRPTDRVLLHAQSMRGHAPLHHATLDVRHRPGGTGLAVRAVATATATQPRTPLWRAPGWGGGTVLRHGRYLQYQAPLLAGGVAEWCQEVAGPLQVAAFTEAAWVGAWALGGGIGAAVALPPRPSSTVRIDAAWGGSLGGGPGGWGVSTGWGQAF